MNASEVVRRYAATLLDAAEETGVLDAVRQDVDGVLATVDQSQDLAAFLQNPLLNVETQQQALVVIFADKLQKLTLNFLSLMTQRRRASLVVSVLKAFLELLEERQGVVSAEVRSAVELSAEQQERLCERLADYTGKQVRLHAQMDPSLRGGVVARVGDTVFDGSLNTHLERLHRQLVGA
jgi:F-type H+-transporting ATPase subunit delta